jgi:hypothetical protein
MRRRRSAIASSGMSIWKGRISVSLDMSLNLRELADDEGVGLVLSTIADRVEVSRP